jgi:hypothetical protein
MKRSSSSEIVRISDRIKRRQLQGGIEYMKSIDYTLDMYAIVDQLPNDEKGKVLLKGAIGRLFLFGLQTDELWTGYQMAKLPEPLQPNALRHYQHQHNLRLQQLRNIPSGHRGPTTLNDT